MTDEKPDFGSTTAVVTWVRKRVSPSAVWGAITALAIAIGYVVNAQHDISHLKETVIKLEAERNVAAGEREQDRQVLNKIDTQLAVMGGKVDTIADEVARQREWRDRIEGIAEAPPHARRKH